MKKFLLFCGAFLVVVATFAQQSNLVDLPSEGLTKGYDAISLTPPNNFSSSAVAPAVIWYDDCSDASTWIFTNTSTLGLDWYIELDANATPAGGALTPMASASADNGFLMINSDADGGTTDNDGTTISAEFTNATPIDLTNYPNVQLTFEHNFRWWKDTRVVRISPDNGVTWVELDEITNFTGYTYPDQSSNNPHMSTYDISAIAGGQSEVLVQFYYNDNDIWAWYWAVDDIAISELPDNKVVCTDEVIGGWWINYQTVGGLGQDYTFIPSDQASANPFAFEAVVRNGGIATQDITLYAKVTGAGSANASSNVLTLAASEQDTIATTSGFTPASPGLYNIELWSVGDSVGAGITYTYSDTAMKMAMVGGDVYGKDFNSAEGYWRLNRILPAPGGFEVSSNYDIYSDVNLCAIDVNISDWSVPGAEVYAVLYEEDPAGGDPIPIDQSDNYTITQTDLGNWITIPFLSPIPLSSSVMMYRIAVGANIHPTDTVGVNMSGNGQYSSDGLFDKDDWYENTTAPGPTWYTISDIPMLRMNFDPSTISNVSNIKQSIFNIYPNPTDGVFSVDLDINSEYIITVANSLGQTVLSTITNGVNTIIDLSDFESGVYTVELNDGKSIFTEKVVLE